MQLDWPFFPLVNQYANHPITRNLDASLLKFVSSIDTVKATGVKKTPLVFLISIFTQSYSTCKGRGERLRKQMQEDGFESQEKFRSAYLLEGYFTSSIQE
jgi:ABC-2 type transport system permease protein